MLTGTLSDVGLDELSSLLQQQQRTGLLVLTLETRTVRILFRDGTICQVDDQKRPPSLLIGELLVAGGLITRSDLAAALEEQRTTTKALGAILVGQGELGLNDLHRYLHLQFRETLYPLFTVTEGTFAFDTETFTLRNCAPPPLAVEGIALEAVRIIDELPELRRYVPSPRTEFRKVTEAEELPEEGPLAEEMTEREENVFRRMSGLQTAESLVGPTCLGTFDVIKALSVLYRAGHLVRIEAHDAVAYPTLDKSGPTVFQRRSRFFVLLFHTVLALLATVTALALLVQLSLHGAPPEGTVRFPVQSWPSAQSQLSQSAHLDLLAAAVEVYQLQRLEYPARLTDLVEAEVIDQEDLSHPGYEEPYYYRRAGGAFVLLPPKR